MQRRLTAILSADVVGYSGLMQADETGTMLRLKQNRSAVFDPLVAEHGGRIFKLMGDGALVEFASVVAALNCALAIQKAMAGESGNAPIRYRIGVNLGDVMIDGDDIYGDGVNVAARLQTIAPVGGVALSRAVREQVDGKVQCAFDDMGEHTVKSHERPVHAYCVRALGGAPKVHAPPAAKLSVCVLPFANMSDDPEQEYFSDGISEDIITDLSRVSALSVVSRNSAFRYKGQNVDLPKVARELNVTHVLEGSVRKAGKRVRITAQLIDGRIDSHVWAERWDRDLDDIFALQDEISEEIVKALKVRLLPNEKRAIERRDTESTDAYETFLMARRSYVTENMTDPARAAQVIALCRRAIEIDPNYARAWSLLATAQRRQSYAGKGGDGGLAAAERALALDSTLADAHAVRLGKLLEVRDYEQARAVAELALKLDPESYEVHKEAAHLAFIEHRYVDAARHWEKNAEQSDEDYSSTGMLMSCYTALNDKVATRRAAERTLRRVEAVIAHNPANGSALSFGIGALGYLGHVARAKEWMKRALLLEPDNVNMRYNLACTLILDMHEIDAGLDLLEPALAAFSRERLSHALADPDLDSVREHPRYKAMMAAAEARLAAG
ncbi:MAG: adenylate/guanylate cyclase domain-containing protein [Alphaproteobacteria bacterium]|nr:adenylate/guanylate cyclase domain-containing protein [Alphaproteobacteria bacterium]MBL7098822.1 adenylate/guanylate cyclase domain-containing protein [Alphaproteobacteria bacterium]